MREGEIKGSRFKGSRFRVQGPGDRCQVLGVRFLGLIPDPQHLIPNTRHLRPNP